MNGMGRCSRAAYSFFLADASSSDGAVESAVLAALAIWLADWLTQSTFFAGSCVHLAALANVVMRRGDRQFVRVQNGA